MEKKQQPKCTLIYQQHQLKPEDILDFVEMDGFTADWKRLGLKDIHLWMLQVAIMSGPRQFKVMRGTGGLRKIRFAPAGGPKGKSGAYRVCFVWFPECSMALLVKAFAKNEKDNLTASERNGIKGAIETIRNRIKKKLK